MLCKYHLPICVTSDRVPALILIYIHALHVSLCVNVIGAAGKPWIWKKWIFHPLSDYTTSTSCTRNKGNGFYPERSLHHSLLCGPMLCGRSRSPRPLPDS